MLTDTQVHLVDPVRFPFDPSSGGYIPAADETATAEDLLAVFAAHGVGCGVLVQPSGYGTDNALAFDARKAAGDKLRVIAMAGADDVADMAAAGASGLRLNLTDYAPHDAEAARAIGSAVLDQGLVLQVQAVPGQLAPLLARLPAGPVVLDHLGRVSPEDPEDVALLSGLAARPDTWLKVSGGFRLGRDWRTPSERLVALVRDWPGDRVIWGSDWPFLNVGGTRPSYAEVMDWAATLTDLAAASRNAARLFGWEND